MQRALINARVFDGEAVREGLAVILDGPQISAVHPVQDVEPGIARVTR